MTHAEEEEEVDSDDDQDLESVYSDGEDEDIEHIFGSGDLGGLADGVSTPPVSGQGEASGQGEKRPLPEAEEAQGNKRQRRWGFWRSGL